MKLLPENRQNFDVPLITGKRGSNAKHHTGNGDLKQASQGELYPWCAVTIGHGIERGRIEGRNLVSGEVLDIVASYDQAKHDVQPLHYYDWDQANARIVELIKSRIAVDACEIEHGSYLDAMRELAELGYPSHAS